MESDTTAERLRPWRRHLPALAAYLLLTMVYCHRVVGHLFDHLAGHGGDGWQNLWNMWWLRQAITSGVNPYFTTLLHHPHGHTLLYHTLNPFNGMLALPFDFLLGQPAAYNLVFLFSFVASGFTMYLLAHELGAGRVGAFLAGCLFTFSPFHFAHAQGHLQLTAMEWLPLFLLLAWRLWQRGGVGNGLGAGLSLGMTTFCSIYYLVAGVLVAGLAAVYLAVRQPRRLVDRRLWWSLAAAGASFLLSGGVLVVAMLLSYRQAGLAPAHQSSYWSADLQAFLVPSWILAYGDWFAGISSRWTGNSAECSQYLGLLPLGLGVVALWPGSRRPRPWGWLALLLLGVVLSLGPHLHWGGRIHHQLLLPFGWLERLLPWLGLSGAPVRWHIVTLVALAVLAGLGLGRIHHRLLQAGSRRRMLLLAAIIAACLAEYWPRWVETRPLPRLEFCRQIARAPAGEAVYDLGDGNEALLRQTLHHHPLVGGYIARTSRRALDFLRSQPLLRILRGESSAPASRVLALAAGLRLRHLIVPAGRQRPERLRRLGLVLLAQEAGLQWWAIPW